jgi:hypothetical protein
MVSILGWGALILLACHLGGGFCGCGGMVKLGMGVSGAEKVSRFVWGAERALVLFACHPGGEFGGCVVGVMDLGLRLWVREGFEVGRKKAVGIQACRSTPMARNLGDWASRGDSEWEGATAQVANSRGRGLGLEREGKRHVLGLR